MGPGITGGGTSGKMVQYKVSRLLSPGSKSGHSLGLFPHRPNLGAGRLTPLSSQYFSSSGWLPFIGMNK